MKVGWEDIAVATFSEGSGLLYAEPGFIDE